MASKNRIGEIFIIRGSNEGKSTYSCWLICDKFYDTYFKEYVYDIKILYDQYSITNNHEEAFGSDIKMFARRKSTRIVKFDDL